MKKGYEQIKQTLLDIGWKSECFQWYSFTQSLIFLIFLCHSTSPIITAWWNSIIRKSRQLNKQWDDSDEILRSKSWPFNHDWNLSTPANSFLCFGDNLRWYYRSGNRLQYCNPLISHIMKRSVQMSFFFKFFTCWVFRFGVWESVSHLHEFM